MRRGGYVMKAPKNEKCKPKPKPCSGLEAPELDELQKLNMELGNQELAARVELRKLEILSSRIEHARRNVEILYRNYTSGDDSKYERESDEHYKERMELRKLLAEGVKVNLEILKETEKIK